MTSQDGAQSANFEIDGLGCGTFGHANLLVAIHILCLNVGYKPPLKFRAQVLEIGTLDALRRWCKGQFLEEQRH
jgi:hypothetical protein